MAVSVLQPTLIADRQIERLLPASISRCIVAAEEPCVCPAEQ